MPTCKNDCKRYYRGDEPSPKGLGHCAHAEKINQRRRGKDGKFWVVKAVTMKTGKRIRRWTRVKKVVTKKRKGTKTTKKKSKLKGGVGNVGYGSYGMHIAGREIEKKRIADLMKQLRQCQEQEDKLKRERSKEQHIQKKEHLSKDIELCQASCDKIHTELRRLGALR